MIIKLFRVTQNSQNLHNLFIFRAFNQYTVKLLLNYQLVYICHPYMTQYEYDKFIHDNY